MKKFLIFLIFLIFFSCKKEVVEKFYYPNKTEFFRVYKNSSKLEISNFNSFEKLVDTLENLNYKDYEATFKIRRNNNEYNFVSSTFSGKCSGPPRIKFFNVLSISKDSILKKDSLYSIDNLTTLLKKDLLNYGKDRNFSESPEKLIVSVTEKKESLEILLIKIFKEFNKIQSHEKDSLYLKINFNRRLEIFPHPPKIEE
jgi:hypothetical protein